ncbi:hypothetical protein PSN45_002213 [Yamadazyma tenuis]|nr:hypothetical protein PSN45_002213 [Yamadazyma tenuis]
MNRTRLAILISLFVLVGVGLETGLIVWLRPLYRRDIKYPMLIVGIIASVLLAVGLIPPYFELAKRRGRVVGINFVFLSLDSLGALLSMLSVVVGTFDTLSIVLYAIVLGLELGIFSSQITWYFILGGRRVIKQEQAEKRRLEDEKSSTNEDDNDYETSTHNSTEGDVDVVDSSLMGIETVAPSPASKSEAA